MCSSPRPTSINDGLDLATALDLRSLFGLVHLGTFILWIIIISFGLSTLGMLHGLSTLGMLHERDCPARNLDLQCTPWGTTLQTSVKGNFENCFYAKSEEIVSNVSTWSLYAQYTHYIKDNRKLFYPACPTLPPARRLSSCWLEFPWTGLLHCSSLSLWTSASWNFHSMDRHYLF